MTTQAQREAEEEMGKRYLVTTRERELATLAFCESHESYVSLEQVPAHESEQCVLTWLRQEIA